MLTRRHLLRLLKTSIMVVAPTTVGMVSWTSGLNLRQIIALVAFTFEIAGITLYWEHKLAFAALGLFLLFSSGVLDISSFVNSAFIDVIVFLMCMMIVVWYLEERGFFEYMVDKLVEKAGGDAYKLTVFIMILSAVFSALVDVVTASLFMIPIVLRVTLGFRVNPVPFIFMTVFAANIGSSATVVGNPVGVILALKAGLSFYEFLRWATPITILSLLSIMLLCLKVFSRHIKLLDRNLKALGAIGLEEGSEHKVRDPREMVKCWLIFIGVILLILLHRTIEDMLHLEEGVMLISASLFGASIILFIEKERIRDILERGVDWYTLIFFMFLFASIGALEHAGITEIMAHSIALVCGGDIFQLIFITAFLCGILSALMDNVLAIALFISVIHGLEAMGVNAYPLWWGILFASTYFGNFTIIGSTANIVAIGMLEARKIGTISFTHWVKYGAIVSLLSLTLALILLYAQLPLIS